MTPLGAFGLDDGVAGLSITHLVIRRGDPGGGITDLLRQANMVLCDGTECDSRGIEEACLEMVALVF